MILSLAFYFYQKSKMIIFSADEVTVKLYIHALLVVFLISILFGKLYWDMSPKHHEYFYGMVKILNNTFDLKPRKKFKRSLYKNLFTWHD